MWKTTVTLALLICVQVCAHEPLYPRIVNGTNAQKKDWPWIVSLHNPTCHFCGGSLISKQWVLSAAHCFSSVAANSVLVYLGKMTQRGKNWKQKMIKVQRIFTHNMYNPTITDYDIALLHLTSPVEFNARISPVRLIAQGSDFPTNTRSQIIGWGQIAEGVNVPYPGILQQAEVSVMDPRVCENDLNQFRNELRLRRLTTNRQLTNNMICAGVPARNVDTLYGDSGGPLVSPHCSKWVQFGITSWGFVYGSQSHRIGVYTRISQFQQWITDTIRNQRSQDFPQFVDGSQPC